MKFGKEEQFDPTPVDPETGEKSSKRAEKDFYRELVGMCS